MRKITQTIRQPTILPALPYEDLRLTASPEPSYEDLRLTRFTCTMLKISFKPFFRSLHNCLINRSLQDLKPGFPVICNKLHSLGFEPQTRMQKPLNFNQCMLRGFSSMCEIGEPHGDALAASMLTSVSSLNQFGGARILGQQKKKKKNFAFFFNL